MREARAGDRYLLCSDGLSGVVSEETLAEALKDPDPQSTADRLVELALRSGGPDNITVIVADVVEDSGSGFSMEPVVDGAAGDNRGQREVDPRSAAGRAALADPPPAPPTAPGPVVSAPAPGRGRRRLFWLLVALLLVAAAAAVPMLLSEEPGAPAAPAVAAVKSDDSTLTTEPIVALATEGDRAERRRVLGSPKNPFKPNATPTPEPKQSSPAQAPASAPESGAGTGGGGAGAPVSSPGSSGGGATPVSPGFTTPLAPVTPKKKYELYELTVRFGSSEEGDQPRQDVKRLEALPSSQEPVLIYLGVLKDNKTAVFMVESGVVAQGDGVCRPSRTVCETIHLKEGETEFFDIPSESADGTETSAAQYQLDVVKIRRKVTTSAKKANRSLARVSKSGRKILRARIAGDGPLRYRYDQATGQLEKRSAKAFKAAVAKAAKAARAHF
jgi:hypothetical protein